MHASNLRCRSARATQSFHIALLLISIFIGSASGRTWYIKADGTGDAPTIQAGVDLASPGDVVLVGSGTYSDMSTVDIDGVPTTVCVAINKDLQLISQNGSAATTIGNPAVQVAIYLHDAGTDLTLTGFRVETLFYPYGCVAAARSAAQPAFQIGIKCKNFGGSLTGNNIVNNGIGVELTASPAVVDGNEFVSAFWGIDCHAGSNVTVTDNVMRDCATMVRTGASALQITSNDMRTGCIAIDMMDRSSASVRDNDIQDVSTAVGCGGGGSVVMESNRVRDTSVAVYLAGTRGTTVVRGNVFFQQGSAAISLNGNPSGAITIERNTIDLTTYGSAIFCQAGSSPIIRGNIITRSYTTGISCVVSSFPTFECNDIFDAVHRYGGDCPDQTGLNGNISADPQFCGMSESGNYSLQSDSPCAAGNHPSGYECEGMGAFGVGCGSVSTKTVTWGAIKAMYRR